MHSLALILLLLVFSGSVWPPDLRRYEPPVVEYRYQGLTWMRCGDWWLRFTLRVPWWERQMICESFGDVSGLS